MYGFTTTLTGTTFDQALTKALAALKAEGFGVLSDIDVQHAMKEKLGERLEALKGKRDDMLTIEELGVDQVIVDEAQEFRKLSFATNRTTLKGVDPNGSQRAWDLYVKSRFIEMKNPGRALVLASGTPITNTLGEMFSIQRLLGRESGQCVDIVPVTAGCLPPFDRTV